MTSLYIAPDILDRFVFTLLIWSFQVSFSSIRTERNLVLLTLVIWLLWILTLISKFILWLQKNHINSLGYIRCQLVYLVQLYIEPCVEFIKFTIGYTHKSISKSTNTLLSLNPTCFIQCSVSVTFSLVNLMILFLCLDFQFLSVLGLRWWLLSICGVSMLMIMIYKIWSVVVESTVSRIPLNLRFNRWEYCSTLLAPSSCVVTFPSSFFCHTIRDFWLADTNSSQTFSRIITGAQHVDWYQLMIDS